MHRVLGIEEEILIKTDLMLLNSIETLKSSIIGVMVDLQDKLQKLIQDFNEFKEKL